MTSSGIKRGVASAAISALAVAGLPFLAGTASADAYTDQIGTADTVLYTQYSGAGSVVNDGTNTTIHLLAGGGSTVQQVTFQYRETALSPWVDIATVSRANGGFSTEWAPSTSIYNLGTVQVRALGLNSVGTPVAGTADQRGVTVGTTQPSVNIANAAGSNVPTFKQPYAGESATGRLGVISGQTSDVAGDAEVTVSNLTSGEATGSSSATLAPAAGGFRTFEGVVNFEPYTFDVTAPIVNQAVVGASNGSDDGELVTLSNQAITTVTAVADPTTVQGAQTADGVITVTDAAGAPIAGAQVFLDADNDGVWDVDDDETPENEGEQVVYSDENGQAVFEGLAGSPSGSTYAFIVNTTDGNNYEPAVDFRRTITVSSYTPAATSLAAASKDGAAFDVDEFTSGDVTVTVKDQNGANLPGASLTGSWTYTPFNGDPAVTEAASFTDGNADGVYDANNAFAGREGTFVLNSWIERDGNPGQTAGDLSAAPLTVKSGESNLVWADEDVAQAPAGTTAVFEGTIELDDETPLPNRNVAISWDADGGNTVVAAQGAQPAGTTRVSDSAATAVSDASGNYGVAISDQVNPGENADQFDEGYLMATAANTPAYGTNNDNSSDWLNVEFLEFTDVDADNTETYDYSLDGGVATPGRPAVVEIYVENEEGDSLTDLPVTVTTDHGFFTTPEATSSLDELIPDPAAAEGANYGEWEDLGTSYNTETDDSGYATATVAIERDVDFDDDGMVEANVEFEVGGQTFTQVVEFDSSNPLNPGELTITLAEDQDVLDTVLPMAPTSEVVYWDVKATDQFGNRTDELVDVTDNGSPAGFWDGEGNYNANYEGDWAFFTYSNVETDQTIEGEWDADTTTWTDANDVLAGFQEEDTFGNDGVENGDETLTAESIEINWYEIDYSASSFTLTHSGVDPQPVGSTVTMTYTAIDQNGQPISDLGVEFYRSGPDGNATGELDGFDDTNDAGEAYYVFQGEVAGKAVVTALAYNDDNDPDDNVDDLIPSSEASDTVTFAGQVDGPTEISIGLNGKNNGGKDDVLKVVGPKKAAGATVKLFKITKAGKKVLVGSGKLNGKGDKSFTVADKNGKKFTKYVAKVKKTVDTLAARSNKESVR